MPAHTEARHLGTHPDAGLPKWTLPAPPRGTSLPNWQPYIGRNCSATFPAWDPEVPLIFFFASFSYISMKEQLLQKSVKILSLEGNKNHILQSGYSQGKF